MNNFGRTHFNYCVVLCYYVIYYFKDSIILLTYKLDSSYIHCQACDREAWEKEAKLVFLISQGIRGHGPTRFGQGDKRRGMTFTPGLNHKKFYLQNIRIVKSKLR